MHRVAGISVDALEYLREAVLDRTPVSLGPRRTASPHEFYRYPARFAPAVAAAAIATFTKPGDTVADYFVGGGTTSVEARLAGRLSIGSDINSLATFVTTAKTRLYSQSDLIGVLKWAESRNASHAADLVCDPGDATLVRKLRNFDTEDMAGQRAVILDAVKGLADLHSTRAKCLAKCILLRTAQWAFDMRQEVPSSDELANALSAMSNQMVEAAAQATARYRAADRATAGVFRPRSLVIQQGLPGLAGYVNVTRYGAPNLVLTSPPYPGVYVNYHRWKLRGRLETPLPYFIAGQQDGQGLAHYTMSARSDRSLDTYFRRLGAAFEDIAAMCGRKTWILQVVGFNDVEAQLPRYLSTLFRCGLKEVRFDALSNSPDGRLWRDVPGRRWWTRAGDRSVVAPHTAREVLLVHRRT